MTEEARSREDLRQELAAARAECKRLEALVHTREQALREAGQQLQQAQKMEALGTLVAGVAHEINNPINLILYNLPLLRKTWADFMPLLLEHRRSQPDRTFGGFTYDFLKDHLPQLVADTAVRNALRLCQSTLRKAGVNITLELPDGLPDIEGNLQNIEQIVLNILINAVQAIDHPHGEISIQTGFTAKDGRVHLRISDNGRGIAPAIADRIFLPFVTDKQSQGGTGLGLSVSYSLVKAHGGEIRFENRASGGTTFTVRLPTVLKRDAAKILVVDDDRMVRQILLEALAIPRRYLLEEAANGIEASIRLGTYRPDLLILDVFMPEMDGLEVCRSIRAEPELAGMKVIITTGFPGHPKLDELAELGYTHVLAKPFNIPELMHTVETLLSDRLPGPTLRPPVSDDFLKRAELKAFESRVTRRR
jgi:CheY-like chemotaxis protein